MSDSHDLLDRRSNPNAAAAWSTGVKLDASPAAGKSDKLDELLGRIAKLTGQEPASSDKTVS